MDRPHIDCIPDLILSVCPLGCNRKCAGMWKNEITGHRIICICECNHKQTLARVWDPEANILVESSSSSEVTKENGLQ